MSTNLTIPDYLKESENDVHKRILDNAPNAISAVEGDLFWDSTRPVSVELARTKNIAMLNTLKSRFVQTASDGDLDLTGEEDGIYRKPSTYALQLIQFTGSVGTIIPKGRTVATVGTDENTSIEFEIQKEVVIDATGVITVEAKCLALGIIGNVAIGNITVLVKSIYGIQKVTNIEIVEKGVEIESDDDYRYRIILKAQTPATSGNVYHYMNWALEVPGVGAVKVKPLWDKSNGMNGNGTVKVVIADSDRHAVAEGLIIKTFDYIEAVRPIGATVTVISAIEKALITTANITLAAGFTIGQIQTEFNELLTEYLKSIAFKATYISINKIGNILFDTSGVIDYSDLNVNGATGNIPLVDEEIAICGSIKLGVIS